jgi:hypothetical protein
MMSSIMSSVGTKVVMAPPGKSLQLKITGFKTLLDIQFLHLSLVAAYKSIV